MTEALEEINRHFINKNYPEFNIGIGLHTGEVILGNIGSEKKLDYTVIGDNVNLASRMEGLTKPYSSTVLISESTYNQLDNSIPCRIIDQVRVKGKNRPIKIYQPLQENDTVLLEMTESAFGFYLRQEWQKSTELYKKIIKHLGGNDRISELFIDRCIQYSKSPPSDDWDGTFTMKSK
jgi:adenylate cyclase